ncbi:oxysterol-binding protein 1-like [Centruroides sculpturatus]|nr:oxysterol-binding protein 1-like [Centruroides sculpturatus]
MADVKFQQQEPEMKGWLYKWTNYLKGYQKRWFVLSNGLLSYYRNQMEMSHTCRGTISLVSAVIHTEDSCNFVISNGGTQTFHLKATSEVERQRWVTALELAKARAIRMMESGIHSDDDEFYDAEEHTAADFVVTIPGKGHR